MLKRPAVLEGNYFLLGSGVALVVWVTHAIAQLTAPFTFSRFVLELVRPDGYLFVLRILAVLLILAFSAYVQRLVSLQRKGADALQQSEQRFRILAENARDMIYTYQLEPEFRLSYINPAVLEATGYTPEEHYANPGLLASLTHPEDRHLLPTKYDYKQPIKPVTLRQYHRDGSLRWIEHQINPIWNPAGELEALHGLSRDITRRVEAEQALQQSETRYRAISEMTSDYVYGLRILPDRQVVPEWANQSSLQLLGYSFEELSALGGWSALIHPEDRPIFLESTWGNTVGRMNVGPYRIITKQGHVRWIQGYQQVDADPVTGAPSYVIGATQDITERVLAENALRESEQRNRAIIEAVPDILFRIDRVGNVQDAHVPDQSKIFFKNPILIGSNVRDIVPDSVAATHLEYIHRALDEDSTQVYEFTIPGLEPPTVFEARLVVSGHEEVVAIVRDITERKESETAHEQALQDDFRRTVRNIQNLIFKVDRRSSDGEMIYNFCEGKLAQRFGWTTEALRGLTFDDVWGATYTDGREELRRALQGESVRSEFHLDDFWFLSSIEPIVEDGIVVSLIGSVIDITIQHQMRDRLRASEEKFRDLVEQTTDWIWEVAADGRCIYSSPKVKAILGYEPEEMIGQMPLTTVLADDAARISLMMDQLVATRSQVTAIEHTTQHRDGHLITVETSALPIINAEGDFVGYRGITRDITARKTAEVALRQEIERREREQQRLRAVLNILPVGVILADANGQVVEYNAAAQRGWEVMPKPGQSADDHFYGWWHASGEAIKAVDWPLNRAIREGKSILDSEIDIVTSDGQRRTLLGNAVPIKDEANMTVGGVCAFVDITERERIEAELRTAFTREKELGELKSRFVAMTSHEFRTPLATILAASSVLKDYGERMSPLERRARLDKVQAEVFNMTTLLEDVLTIGKADAGQLTFRPTLLDCVAVVREIVDEMHPSIGQHPLQFDAQTDTATMLLDQHLLRRIVTNLVGNAAKYSPAERPITVVITADPTAVTITVADQGIGIPAADQPHLFEVFHRATNVGAVPGTGLGLAISKKAVEVHGGSITVASTEGVGTTFTVRLPRYFNRESLDEHDSGS